MRLASSSSSMACPSFDLTVDPHLAVVGDEGQRDPGVVRGPLDEQRQQLVDADPQVVDLVDAQAGLGTQRCGHDPG